MSSTPARRSIDWCAIFSLAEPSCRSAAGATRPISSPKMASTTKSSSSVKPRCRLRGSPAGRSGPKIKIFEGHTVVEPGFFLDLRLKLDLDIFKILSRSADSAAVRRVESAESAEAGAIMPPGLAPPWFERQFGPGADARSDLTCQTLRVGRVLLPQRARSYRR